MSSRQLLKAHLDALLAYQRERDAPCADVARIIVETEKVLQRSHPDLSTALVNEAIERGKLCTCQRTWAEKYVRRDPEAFMKYVRESDCPMVERIKNLERRYEALP